MSVMFFLKTEQIFKQTEMPNGTQLIHPAPVFMTGKYFSWLAYSH